MKLSEKDKTFLEKLKTLYEEKELDIELKNMGYKYFALRQNYGDKIERYLGMTRQGVRWRFFRLFNEIYVSAYETIYFVERNFGTSLRSMALEIVKERVKIRKKTRKMLFFDPPRRESYSGKAALDDGKL